MGKIKKVFLAVLLISGLFFVGQKINHQGENQLVKKNAERRLASFYSPLTGLFSSIKYFERFSQMVLALGEDKLKLTEENYFLKAHHTLNPLEAFSLLQKDKARLILILVKNGYSKDYIRSKIILKYSPLEQEKLRKISIAGVDLNQDGELDDIDRALLTKEIVRLFPYFLKGDFDKDGKTDIWDLITFNSISSYILKI